MEANNQKAIKFGKVLKDKFPCVDWYVPGEHDEFVLTAYQMGILSEETILNVDCEILSGCNFMVMFTPDYFQSRGMVVEKNYAIKHSIPIFTIVNPKLNEANVQTINMFLESLMR